MVIIQSVHSPVNRFFLLTVLWKLKQKEIIKMKTGINDDNINGNNTKLTEGI